MIDVLIGTAIGCAGIIACYIAYRHGHQAGADTAFRHGFAAGCEMGKQETMRRVTEMLTQVEEEARG